MRAKRVNRSRLSATVHPLLGLTALTLCIATNPLRAAEVPYAPALQREPEQSPRDSARIGFFERLFGPDVSPDRTGNRRGKRPASVSTDRDSLLLRPHQSFVKAISSKTPPRRAAALRLAERGRAYLLDEEYARAVSLFEKALSLEAEPYFHYYLSQAHYHLGHYALSAQFLEVASSRLGAQSEWTAELAAHRANFMGKDAEGPSVARVRALPSSGGPAASGM